MRANAGNAGPTLSIGASTTGIFNDNTDLYNAATTDAMNYQVVTASTGTSMSISFIAVWGNASTATTTASPGYRHFDNTGRQRKQNYNSFGTQMIVFG